MIDTGWDNDSAMMNDILTLDYTYEQEMKSSLGPGIPLMYGMEFMKHGNFNVMASPSPIPKTIS